MALCPSSNTIKRAPSATNRNEIRFGIPSGDKLVSESGAAGDSVFNNEVTVDSDSLYKLIKLQEPGKHILKLEFLDANTEAYAFTFG